MLQQTTVAAVGDYFAAFLARWPTVGALAAAPDAEVMAAWAGLGYYARARNLLACARVVARELGGRFPDTEEGLRALPGVGAYTAAAVAAIAFGRRAVVVDGNVERVMARLFAIETPLPAAKPRLVGARRDADPRRAGRRPRAGADGPRRHRSAPRSARPAASARWSPTAPARRAGIAAELPRRAAKPAKPVRRGIAYLAVRADGAVLVETRPANGLLGGMLGLPTSDWTEGEPAARAPLPADWRDLRAEVRHTFTHFHLRLRLQGARVGDAPGDFRPEAEAGPAMPTLMRKALRLGLASMASEDAGFQAPGPESPVLMRV